ncbi:hypothetical protein OS493_031639 [Desmophyllum pertusum]|uniref:Uncharacterized protein n=1 Tax=Desmophyllum pertusum TaxID=174260 RepID=A0A9X0CEB4_9CNID|nr:hypothetical protein OS493_031639 [Desmophyllum pertusum]
MVIFSFVPSPLVLSRHSQDAIDVNFKGDLNLRHTAWCRWDSSEIKLAEQMRYLQSWASRLQTPEFSCGEYLGLLCWDDRVSGDKFGHKLHPRSQIPKVSGLTSRSTTSPVSSSPPNTPACTAAPKATASSGLMPRLGSLPSKSP